MKEREWRREFAHKLMAMMKEQGLSQGELARRSGLAVSTINAYLSQYRTPNVRGVVNITYALGCDINELVDVSEPIR